MGNDTIGVWATNDIASDAGMIFSVNAIAVEFSEWGDGSTYNADYGGSCKVYRVKKAV